VGRHTEDSIKKYIMRWGTNKYEFVEWSFLQDGDFFSINENTFVLPDALEYNIDLSEADLNIIPLISFHAHISRYYR